MFAQIPCRTEQIIPIWNWKNSGFKCDFIFLSPGWDDSQSSQRATFCLTILNFADFLFQYVRGRISTTIFAIYNVFHAAP